jgi:hypothetical protein
LYKNGTTKSIKRGIKRIIEGVSFFKVCMYENIIGKLLYTIYSNEKRENKTFKKTT